MTPSSRPVILCLVLVAVLLGCRTSPAASEGTSGSAVQAAAASDSVNVVDFGAIADDGQDDTGAIQRAIDSGNSVIHVPAGEFMVTLLEIGDGQTLSGAGMYTTRLKLPNHSIAPSREVGIIGLTFKEGAEEVGFRNFEYDGNSGGEGNRDWLGKIPFGSLGVNGIYLGNFRQKTPPRVAIIENVFIHDTARNGIVWGNRVEVRGKNWHIRNSDGDHLIYDSGDQQEGAQPVQSRVDGVLLEGFARGPLMATNSTHWSNVTFRNIRQNPADPALWGEAEPRADARGDRGSRGDREARGRNRDRSARGNRDRNRDGGGNDNRDAEGNRIRNRDRDMDYKHQPYRLQSLINAREWGAWGSSFDGVTVENLDPSIAGPRGLAFVMARGEIEMTNVHVELTGDGRRPFTVFVFPGQRQPPTAIQLTNADITGAGAETRLLTFERPSGMPLTDAAFRNIEIEFHGSGGSAPLFDLSGPVRGLEIENFAIRGTAPALVRMAGDPSITFDEIRIQNVQADAVDGGSLIRVAGGTIQDVEVDRVSTPGGAGSIVSDQRGSGAAGAVRIGGVASSGG